MRTVKPQPARRAATSLPVLFAGLSGGIPLHTLLDRSHNITVEALSCRIGSGLHFLFRGAGVLLKDQVYAVICLCVPLVISSSSCGSQTFIPPFLTFSLYRISCTCASVHFYTYASTNLCVKRLLNVLAQWYIMIMSKGTRHGENLRGTPASAREQTAQRTCTQGLNKHRALAACNRVGKRKGTATPTKAPAMPTPQRAAPL